jgi:hypothetical protein
MGFFTSGYPPTGEFLISIEISEFITYLILKKNGGSQPWTSGRFLVL